MYTSDAPDEPSAGSTRVQEWPPSLDRYTPRSPASRSTAAPPARPAPPAPPARGPSAATSTLLAFRGSTTMPPMYWERDNPTFVQLRPLSIDL